MNNLIQWIKEHNDTIVEFKAPDANHIMLILKLQNGKEVHHVTHRYIEDTDAKITDILWNMYEELLKRGHPE